MLRRLMSVLLAVAVAVVAAAQTPPSSSAAAPAAAPSSPYSATVPVAGTSDAQRGAAIGAALTQVLQQVAPGFVATPEQLAQASGYVRDFHYRRAPSGTGLELQVDFDPGAVGRMVSQGGGAATAATGAAAPAAAGSSAAPPATGEGSAAAVAGAAASGNATVWVADVDSSRAFAALLALLRGTPQLHDVVPVAAKGNGVLLQLGYSAPLAGVLASLEGPGAHLTAAKTPHVGADASLDWVH